MEYLCSHARILPQLSHQRRRQGIEDNLQARQSISYENFVNLLFSTVGQFTTKVCGYNLFKQNNPYANVGNDSSGVTISTPTTCQRFLCAPTAVDYVGATLQSTARIHPFPLHSKVIYFFFFGSARPQPLSLKKISTALDPAPIS